MLAGWTEHASAPGEACLHGDARVKTTSCPRGFTLIELLIAVSIIGVIAAIAIPGLLRARMSGNEASAIASLRTINSAQGTYASSCGANGYAQSLADLAKAPAGSAAAFISPDLSANGATKSGYVVNLMADSAAVTVLPAASTCNASANDAVSVYFAEAHPVTVGSTGQRAFATDNRGAIHADISGATIAPGMAGTTVIQ